MMTEIKICSKLKFFFPMSWFANQKNAHDGKKSQSKLWDVWRAAHKGKRFVHPHYGMHEKDEYPGMILFAYDALKAGYHPSADASFHDEKQGFTKGNFYYGRES